LVGQRAFKRGVHLSGISSTMETALIKVNSISVRIWGGISFASAISYNTGAVRTLDSIAKQHVI
jgi:hypothetical protein